MWTECKNGAFHSPQSCSYSKNDLRIIIFSLRCLRLTGKVKEKTLLMNAALKGGTDVFSSAYVLSSCRKKHRLSRLESFTKRVSKKKLFTLAAYWREAALLNSRWPPGLWSHPWPRPPAALPSSMLTAVLKHTMWHAARLPSASSRPASSFLSTTTLRHPELVYFSTGVLGCVSFDWSKT